MRIVTGAQMEGDLRAARAYAVDVVDRLEGIRAGGARPDIVLSTGGTYPRQDWLRGQAARLLLLHVNGDQARLETIAVSCTTEVNLCRSRLAPRQVATLETAAALARQGLGLLRGAGVDPATGPAEREVVLEHLWQGFLREDSTWQRWTWRRRRARARRQDTAR